MKKLLCATLIGLTFAASSAFAATPTTGEYGNHCAWGLTQGKQVMTDRKINWKDSAGKTYCFSSEEAKGNWAKDTTANTKKANEGYAKATGGKGHGEGHQEKHG